MKKIIIIALTLALLLASVNLVNAEVTIYSFSTGSYKFDMPFELVLDEDRQIYHTSDHSISFIIEEKDYSDELKNISTTGNESVLQLMLSTSLNAMDASGLYESRDKDNIKYEKAEKDKDIIIAHKKIDIFGMKGILIGAIDNRGIILTMIAFTLNSDFDIDAECQSLFTSIVVDKD